MSKGHAVSLRADIYVRCEHRPICARNLDSSATAHSGRIANIANTGRPVYL